MATVGLRREAFAFDRRYSGRNTPAFRRANIKAIDKVAEMVLARAKEYAPICTGNLRNSGSLKKYSNKSITVTFSAPYAKEIENGRQASGAVHRVTYRRNGKEISYDLPPGMKPFLMRCGDSIGQWRRVDLSNSTPGVHFLRNAYKDVFQERNLRAAYKAQNKPGFQFMK